MNDTTREVGGALGIAIVGALLSIGYRNGLDGATDELDGEAAEMAGDSLGGLLAAVSEMGTSAPAGLIETGKAAFTDGMQVAMFAAAGVLLATALLVAMFHPNAQGEAR